MNNIEYWKLCNHLTVVQAALLIINQDPAVISEEHILRWNSHDRPDGFNAVFSAIKSAIIHQELSARIVHDSEVVTYVYEGDEKSNRFEETEPNWNLTTVSVKNLKTWLNNHNMRPSFFFNENADDRDYLDVNHPFYSPKLAAAIKAWESIKENPALLKNKTPKQALEKWLREHSGVYGFTDDDGMPLKQAIEDMAKVANWNIKGGVAKTHIPESLLNPSTNQSADIEDNFDDSDFPF